MKQETATPADRLRVLLQMYALALLLAMFISALHAGILFSLGRLPAVAPALGKAYPRGETDGYSRRPCGHFWSFRGAHRGGLDVGGFFLEVGPFGARLPTAGISPLFRTRRSVTVMSCSRNRGGASGRSVRSTGCLLRVFHGRSLPGAANGLAPRAITGSFDEKENNYDKQPPATSYAVALNAIFRAFRDPSAMPMLGIPEFFRSIASLL